MPVFDFLETMLGSIEELEEAILNLTASNIKSFEEDICIGFIALADYENNKFEFGDYKYSDKTLFSLLLFLIEEEKERAATQVVGDVPDGLE